MIKENHKLMKRITHMVLESRTTKINHNET